jgi:hypothetical protein
MATDRRPKRAPPRGLRLAPAPSAADLDAIFAALKALLVRQARHLVVVFDAPDEYTLDTRKHGPDGKPLLFGSVLRRRTHVAYRLMPLDVDASIADALSPALRRHMQGKSSFHFTTPDPQLFVELDLATRAAMASFERRGLA